MSSFFDELLSYADSQKASIVFDNATGRNTFLGELPATPDDCIALIGLVGTTLNAARDVPGLQFPRFQIITRSKDFETAASLLQDVREALHGLIGHDLTDYRVLRCHAEQDGGPLGQDEQGRYEFGINMIAEYHATA